jgi:AcrR family transcriptional regulator
VSETAGDPASDRSTTAVTGGGKPRTRRARGSLSQDEILEAAAQLIDRGGLVQLSMGALARHMDSGVTSIYWYFRSKDELLSALTDRVSHEIYAELPPIGTGPWHEELFAYFAAFRDVLERSPVYREVFAYRVQFLFERAAMRPSVLRRLESGLAFLTEGGLTLEEAADAFSACSNYTRGFVILEHGFDADRQTNAQGTGDRYREDRGKPSDVDPITHPLVSEVGLHRFATLDDHQFDSGLRLLIEGIRQSVRAPS